MFICVAIKFYLIVFMCRIIIFIDIYIKYVLTIIIICLIIRFYGETSKYKTRIFGYARLHYR